MGSEADLSDFKIIFLDVVLTQTILGLNGSQWLLDPEQEFINTLRQAQGERGIVEAFIGQELIAYSRPHQHNPLYYWRRNAPGSEAEIDYLVQEKSTVVPIEVKSSPGSTLKSMHMFLESHHKSSYGVRFSTQNYSLHNTIHSYPLYAVARFIFQQQLYEPIQYNAFMSLIHQK